MENTNKLLAIAALLILFLALGCKKDIVDPPLPEILGKELAGTWIAVRGDAISGPTDDVEVQFVDFAITINATEDNVTYSTAGNGDEAIFPNNGKFDDVEESDNFETGADVIRQPDIVPMTITVSDNGETLTLEFTIDTQDVSVESGNARLAGIDGEYVFILNKQ